MKHSRSRQVVLFEAFVFGVFALSFLCLVNLGFSPKAQAKKDHPRALYYSFSLSLEDSKSKAFLDRYARDRVKKAGYLLLESKTQKLVESQKPPRELWITISPKEVSSEFSLKVTLKDSKQGQTRDFTALEKLSEPVFREKESEDRLTQRSLLTLQMSLDRLLQKTVRTLDTGRLKP